MQPISRNTLVNYVKSSIANVEKSSKEPGQKKASAEFIKENNAFLDTFESRPGNIDEVLEKSDLKMKRRSFWAGATAVGGAVLTVASAGIGVACVGSGALALGLFAAANVLWTGGVAAANLVNRGEEKFQGKLESFQSDIQEGKKPDISSGVYYEPQIPSSSSDDDEFLDLGMNLKGEFGYKISPGLQLGLNGKVQRSF